jgi:dTDP-4-dehydrorhamnose reductase
MIRVGREKGQLRVIADQHMSPTSTADAARAILDALERALPAGTYHLVNSGQASWFEFAQRIIERSGVKAAVEPIPATAYPLPAQRPAYSVLDNEKLASRIGPIPHWTDALDRYLAEKGHRKTD